MAFPDLIGIENDQSQIVLDRISAKLSEKGVILDGTENAEEGVWARMVGMANHRVATFTLPKQINLSEEQIDDKVNEIVEHVSAVIRSGGEKEDDATV